MLNTLMYMYFDRYDTSSLDNLPVSEMSHYESRRILIRHKEQIRSVNEYPLQVTFEGPLKAVHFITAQDLR